VSTELFPSNGRCTVACLHSCYLEMGLHVDMFMSHHQNAGQNHTIKMNNGIFENLDKVQTFWNDTNKLKAD
jgi:hypothetical protein